MTLLQIKKMKVTQVVPCRIVAHIQAKLRSLESRLGPEPDRVTVLLTYRVEVFKQ